MMWRCYLADTMTGTLIAPIDIPSFTWRVTVSDSSFSTTKGKGVGVDEVGSITLPWSAVPSGTQGGREDMLAEGRRALVLMWDNGSAEIPMLFGSISERKDTWLDTTFSIDSILDILSERIFCYEGTFGTGEMWAEDADYGQEGNQGGTLSGITTQDAFYDGWSLRGIASDMGVWCTDRKPGGTLPIDWTYTGERGGHQRTYYGHNASNNSYKKLLDEITNVQDGIDIQFRPYKPDQTHVRLRFLGGTDAEPELMQTGEIPTLSCFPNGGTFQNMEIAYQKPYSRVYGTGAGQDKGQLCHLSEDRTLLEQRDPWPLFETTISDSDWTNSPLLKKHTDAQLDMVKRPVCQIQGTINVSDPNCPDIGEFWSGQLMQLSVHGHPSFPDGVYEMRLMEMSGDETSNVHLIFDPIVNPWYE